MPYLIDGNNLMGRPRDRSARRRVLAELADFARAKRARLTVVFDGAPEEHFPDGSRYRGVCIHYARRGSNADERIKGLVEASRERRTLWVVTSDRALGDYVRACGARLLRSEEFRERIESVLSASISRQNGAVDGKVEPEDLPKWMRYFGAAPEDYN